MKSVKRYGNEDSAAARYYWSANKGGEVLGSHSDSLNSLIQQWHAGKARPSWDVLPGGDHCNSIPEGHESRRL